MYGFAFVYSIRYWEKTQIQYKSVTETPPDFRNMVSGVRTLIKWHKEEQNDSII